MASSITHNPYSIKKLLGLASYASVNMRVRPHYYSNDVRLDGL